MPRRAVDVSGYEQTRNGRPTTVRDYIQMRKAAESPPSMKALHRRGGGKPKIEKIKIRVVDEENADLSYYGEYTDRPTSDLAIDRKERGDWERGQYQYFDPARTEDGPQGVEQDYRRMEAFNRGDWHMVGIYAEATVLVPDGSGNFTIQEVRSGGLYGIESDVGMDYRQETARDEISNLVDQLEAFGLKKADVEKTEVDDSELG